MLKKGAVASVLALFGFFSACILWGTIIKPESYGGLISLLDNNIATVMRLTGGATAASAAVSLIPGDTATPIAEKLADFSTYFLVVLTMLYLEKFMMTLTGFVGFVIGIPVSCFSGILSIFTEREGLWRLTARLFMLSLAIILVLPVSVKVSDAIYRANQPAIDSTLNSASDLSGSIQSEVEKEQEENKDAGLLSNLAGTVTRKVSLALEGAEKLINQYVESLAILIVVSCLVPVLVFLAFFTLLKYLFQMSGELPPLPGFMPPVMRGGRKKRDRHD